jgi:hypothetical protein
LGFFERAGQDRTRQGSGNQTRMHGTYDGRISKERSKQREKKKTKGDEKKIKSQDETWWGQS